VRVLVPPAHFKPTFLRTLNVTSSRARLVIPSPPPLPEPSEIPHALTKPHAEK
jgi:hypothetical protein